MIKRLLLTVMVVFVPLWVYAQVVQIRFGETPDMIVRYLDEYSSAQSLGQYLFNQQGETHCEWHWLELEYVGAHTVTCIFENAFDGAWHLFAEMGTESYLDQMMVIMTRDGEIIHHDALYDASRDGIVSALIPNIDEWPGRYQVFFRIADDGDLAETTAYFEIEHFIREIE